jgi:polyisoprenoid-binding protein YceI
VVVGLLLLGGTYEVLQVFGGSEPAAVALSSPSLSSGGSGDTPGKARLDGNWTIDATSGSLADATSTFAGYRIDEELGGQGAHTAVGRTQQVSGSMTIDGTSITKLSITVDMTTLKSDDDRRDEQLRQRGLETDTYPTATFELTQPIESVRFRARGRPST